MNKRTITLTDKQYIDILTAIKSGFSYNSREYQPNERIATALTLEANLGLRISDILHLHFTDIVRDGERFRLDIVEIKTGKERTFTVPAEIRDFIDQYRVKNRMSEQQRLFDLSERQIQKHLKAACDYLGIDGISTHSFRKYFATQIYLNNGFNIELVRQLLQHSSTAVTQRYIGIQQKQVETALQNHIKLI
ncbi:MAG: tyrosine-type recombinase/integrase [Lachnospiraceae bacterium]|nr:tyrosine-type recombinase/integrase [Lachnospiraceae bacterium]